MARGTFFAGCLQVGAVVLLGTTCGPFPGRPAGAAVLLSSPDEIYSQAFDSLAGSGTGWTNDSTLPGWSLYVQDPALGSVAAPSLAHGSGSSTTGSFYAFSAPATPPGDIALGGVGSGGDYFNNPASGTVAGWIALAVTNNTGGELASFTVSFSGEQWRDGGSASSQTMQFQYGFGSTVASVGEWIAPGGNFDWTSPIHAATATALDGNAAANRVPGLGARSAGSIGPTTALCGSAGWRTTISATTTAWPLMILPLRPPLHAARGRPMAMVCGTIPTTGMATCPMGPAARPCSVARGLPPRTAP